MSGSVHFRPVDSLPRVAGSSLGHLQSDAGYRRGDGIRPDLNADRSGNARNGWLSSRHELAADARLRPNENRGRHRPCRPGSQDLGSEGRIRYRSLQAPWTDGNKSGLSHCRARGLACGPITRTCKKARASRSRAAFVDSRSSTNQERTRIKNPDSGRERSRCPWRLRPARAFRNARPELLFSQSASLAIAGQVTFRASSR